MSTRNKVLLTILALIVISVVLRYVVGGIFEVNPPEVSVRAEPVFSFDSEGFHFGPGMFAHGHPEGFVITNSMIMAVIVTIVLTLLSIAATRNMSVVPRGLQNFAEIAVDGMYNTFGSVDRRYIARFWPLVGTIFFYVLMSNWLALLPGVLSIGYDIPAAVLHGAELEEHGAPAVEGGEETAEGALDHGEETAQGALAHGDEHEENVVVPFLRSPSADLSNTFMLGVVAFFFIEFWGFKALGLGYLYKFFPYKEGGIMIISGLLELLSEFVRVVAFAFRLFGNIFAGEVVILVMTFLFPLLPLPFLGLELFVGFIQAFVFAILAMAFTSLATQGHGDHHEEHHDAGHGEPYHAEVGGTTRQNPVAH